VMFCFSVKNRFGSVSIMPMSRIASALIVRRSSLRCET
jgi:hypothetical protein